MAKRKCANPICSVLFESTPNKRYCSASCRGYVYRSGNAVYKKRNMDRLRERAIASPNSVKKWKDKSARKQYVYGHLPRWMYD